MQWKLAALSPHSRYSNILLLGAAQGLFLALALLNARGGNLVAHRLLALLTFVFAIDLAQEYLHQIQFVPQAPFLAGITVPITLLYAPLVYLYVSALTSPAEFRSGSSIGIVSKKQRDTWRTRTRGGKIF
jgi:hypothetical protein